jgi:hypothetical protein
MALGLSVKVSQTSNITAVIQAKLLAPGVAIERSQKSPKLWLFLRALVIVLRYEYPGYLIAKCCCH